MERGGEKRFHCDHCGEKISKSLYYEHKKIYYSPTSKTWDNDLVLSPQIGELYEDFSFSDHDDNDGIVTMLFLSMFVICYLYLLDASVYDPSPCEDVSIENDEVDSGSDLDFSMEVSIIAKISVKRH